MDYRCSVFLTAVVAECLHVYTIHELHSDILWEHMLYVESIYSRLTGIKAGTLLKCTTCATICRRAGCCGIGLFARRAAGSGPLKG